MLTWFKIITIFGSIFYEIGCIRVFPIEKSSTKFVSVKFVELSRYSFYVFEISFGLNKLFSIYLKLKSKKTEEKLGVPSKVFF